MCQLRDILVVEDEPVVREAAARILRPEGLSIDLAADVAGAREKMEQATYKIILSDLKLPGVPGFELIQAARAAERTTQVIMITGYATLENAVRSFELGAFDFIPKPFDVYELLGVVRRGLRFWQRLTQGEGAQAGAAPEAGTSECSRERFFLGQHTWACFDEDGSVTCGVAESFPGTMDDLETIELPAVEERLAQGDRMARLISQNQLVHRVWAPLSGLIIAINKRLEDDTDRINRDPYGTGWLVRIIPGSPDEELKLLERRSTTLRHFPLEKEQ
jgi:DNA-binding response OmpR family regulator